MKWLTLEKRREFLSLFESYKTINSLSPSSLFIFATDYRPLRSKYRYKLKTVHRQSNSFKYSFLVCIVQPWNNLPEYIVEAGRLETFKERLREYLID